MKIVGYVYGKNVVGKPINQVMVSYIGSKKMNKSENKLKKALTLTHFIRKIKYKMRENITNLKGVI